VSIEPDVHWSAQWLRNYERRSAINAGYDNNLPGFCNREMPQSFYKSTGLADNNLAFDAPMAQLKHKQQLRLQELVGIAKQMNIEVRTEKLLREIGYKPRSGRCRINGQEVVLIDRDAPLSEQIDFLSAVLAEEERQPVDRS
jgi:hypothetical protein